MPDNICTRGIRIIITQNLKWNPSSREFASVRTRANFSLSMRLLVRRSLTPAMFSTARLLKKPTSPVASPMRRARVHLRTMYWNISLFFLDLQSCLNRSFSRILRKDSTETWVKRLIKEITYESWKKKWAFAGLLSLQWCLSEWENPPRASRKDLHLLKKWKTGNYW